MKIYVAGAMTNLREVQDVLALVRSLGHEITLDWTEHLKEEQAIIDGSNLERSRGKAGEIAVQDHLAVKAADLFLQVVPSNCAGRGNWVELGMAIALGKPILVYHLGWNNWEWRAHAKSVFLCHPRVRQVGPGIQAFLAALQEAAEDALAVDYSK